MKTIKLIMLEISNFKGIRHLVIRPEGEPMDIYGDNATGKTTIYDALTWLLFNKNSQGATQFDIKPLDADGNVREAGIIPTVTAVFDVSGDTIKLRKELREKWERARGSAEQRFAGNTTDYFIDDVPRSDGEFKRIIAEIVDENIFRQLTSAHYFCGELKWQDRRKRLFEMCEVRTDKEILADAPEQFAELREAVGRNTVDEYRIMVAEQRKKAINTLDTIPVRIDECSKIIENASMIDFAALRSQESALIEQNEQLKAELYELEHNTLLTEKKIALATVKNDMRQLDMDNTEYRRSQASLDADKRPELQRKINRLETAILGIRQQIKDRQADMAKYEQQIQKYRDEWMHIDARTFQDDGICKLCGQKLPPEQMKDARDSFEALKEQDKQETLKKANRIKKYKADTENDIAKLGAELSDYQKTLEAVRSELQALGEYEEPTVNDLPGYREQFSVFAEKLSGLETEITALQGETADMKRNLILKVQANDAELHRIHESLAAEANVKKADDRIAELNEERRKQAAFQENCDRIIDLCEDYTRYKVQSITDTVNNKFSLVHFRLFRERINGSLEECCDVTVDGVPYNDLNSAGKVNAGLDVISALSEHVGVTVPLFIDNAESVTKLYPINTQVIRLVVSEQDKELRCEA